MAANPLPEHKNHQVKSFGENIESDLALEFLRVVETAAIASARTMGQGERRLSDHVATEAMRQTMDSIPMRGTIVIGEGERDEAPMLFIGEGVGAEFPDGRQVPQVDIAATVCGGCHTTSHTTYTNAPTFEEWSSSGHATVVPGALSSMASSTNNINSCGRCHSGSARLALIDGLNPAVTLANDFNVPITCVVCHDPHQTNANPAQLRNPLSSTNFFSLATSDVFTNKYLANTNINLCGQCHNSRGAAWTDTASAPHHSLQYNFLLGSVGEFADGPATFNPGSHAGLPSSAVFSTNGMFYLTNQCVSCHMQTVNAPYTIHSHTFAIISHDVCMNCHLTEPGQSATLVSNNVALVIYELNLWAATMAPPALHTNGAVLWEYTTPGGLIWQTNQTGLVTSWQQVNEVNFTGPDAAGQTLIPDNIKKARFDLYIVVNDGTLGAHNLTFAINLLNAAQTLVLEELYQ